MFESPLSKFLKSMNIGYEAWHDGAGYDLASLDTLNERDRAIAEQTLIDRGGADWRDIEALDRLGSVRALAELEKQLDNRAIEVRIEAAERLVTRNRLSEAQVEAVVTQSLREMTIQNGMVRTLRFVQAHSTTAVRRKLLQCALHGHDDVRVHSAALALFLYGIATSAFDPAFRTVYYRFGSRLEADRALAYRELCTLVGVDAGT